MAVQAKMPPCSIEAEKSILGSMLVNEQCAISALSTLKSEDFYEKRHRDIFEAASDLLAAAKAIDIVTVTGRLEKIDKMPPGGVEYLSELTDIVPSTENLKYYMEIVKEKSDLRKVIDIGIKMSDKAYKQEQDADDIIGEAGDMIYGIAVSDSKNTVTHIKKALVESYKKLSDAMESQDGLMGVPTGFPTLDRKLSGLQGSQLIIIAGRPGMGKTSFALNIVEHVTKIKKIPTLVISLEMAADQLASRLISSESGVDSQKIRMGSVNVEETNRIAQAIQSLGEAPLYIDDSSKISTTEMLAKAQRLKKQYGLGLIVIDYLQLMSSGTRAESRQNEISQITRTLKVMARELDVPIVLLSQLSRANEKRDRASRKPMLSDLRESGAIEQDADVVIFLHREGYYQDANLEEDDDPNKAEIIIAKQRSGPTGSIMARWNGSLTKYEEVEFSRQEPEF